MGQTTPPRWPPPCVRVTVTTLLHLCSVLPSTCMLSLLRGPTMPTQRGLRWNLRVIQVTIIYARLNLGTRKGFFKKNIVAVLFFSLYTFPSAKFKHLDHRSMVTEAWYHSNIVFICVSDMILNFNFILCSVPEIYTSPNQHKNLRYTLQNHSGLAILLKFH